MLCYSQKVCKVFFLLSYVFAHLNCRLFSSHADDEVSQGEQLRFFLIAVLHLFIQAHAFSTKGRGWRAGWGRSVEVGLGSKYIMCES